MRLRNWVVLGAVLVLAACGGSTSATPSTAPTVVTNTPATPAASATIDLPAPDGATGEYGQGTKSQTSFTPSTVTVAVGSTVMWTNSDVTTHTTTATSGAWNVSLAPGASFSRAFPTAGTFDYKCTIHAAMSGSIIVK